ncbi:MAG: hypothetical protein AB8B62_16855 [Roseobacter sp.]
MKKLMFMMSGLVLSACAKSPDAIAPVSMGNAFASVSCTQARGQLLQEQQTLLALEKKQRNAQVGDAIGVFLLLVPVSSVAGNDVEGKLATSKGKVLALEHRLLTC